VVIRVSRVGLVRAWGEVGIGETVGGGDVKKVGGGRGADAGGGRGESQGRAGVKNVVALDSSQCAIVETVKGTEPETRG